MQCAVYKEKARQEFNLTNAAKTIDRGKILFVNMP